MVKDLVCSIQIDENLSKVTSEYQGKTYYFCSEACKEQFNAKPTSYAEEHHEGSDK